MYYNVLTEHLNSRHLHVSTTNRFGLSMLPMQCQFWYETSQEGSVVSGEGLLYQSLAQMYPYLQWHLLVGYNNYPSTHLDTSPTSEPTLELHSRAARSVEAHRQVSGPNTGRNSGGRQIKKCVRYSNGRYLDPHCTQFGIRVPNVH